jgi:pilus assembly protein CpaB
MSGRSLRMLALAVAFGLGAMVLARYLLTPDPNKREEEMQDVLVAARDLKEEESLKPDMVKVVKMAKSAVPPTFFSTFKDVDDRWVNMSMLEGDVLIEKKLGLKGTPPGMVNNIPKGMRALSIDVTEQTGVSGFILPGSRVDVIRFDNTEKKGNLRGETILQDVQVLAANQVFIRPEERAVQSRTVTLAVSPENATVLVAARTKGPLSLALRGVNDHEVVSQSKPKSSIEDQLEIRLKEEEAKRIKLEQDFKQDFKRMQEELARMAEKPPLDKPSLPSSPPRPPPPPERYLAIYRGMQVGRPQIIQIDIGYGENRYLSPGVVPIPEAPSSQPPLGIEAAKQVAATDQHE